MAKSQKKLTNSQKALKKKAKLERQKEYVTVFMNGKQVKVKRPELIDGIPIADFILKNADPVFLHQSEMWEFIDDSAK